MFDEKKQLKPRLRRDAAAEYLGSTHGIPIAKTTLAKLACLGGGPSFQKMGRLVLYPVAELDRWAETKLSTVRRSTSDPGLPKPDIAHAGVLAPRQEALQ
jgi:hypothetical protein